MQVRETSIRWKFLWLMMFAGIFALSILACVFVRQAVQRDRILNRVDSKWTAFYEVPPRRGSIRARGGSILAISEKTYEVVLDPTALGNDVLIADVLSRELDLSLGELLPMIQEARANGSRYLRIKDGLTHAQMVDIHNLNLKGVFISENYQRYYPFKDQMSPHTIGFIRTRDNVYFQAEKAFDKMLSGSSGRIYYQRDSKWGRIPETTYVDREVVNGRDVYLTIDENIQTVCDIELEFAIERNRASWGLVAVMDPYTGEILANAVRPTFDPNECVRGATVDAIAANPLYGYVVEPGSIIKPIMIAGALERGYVDLDKMYYCPASLKVKDIVVTEAHKGFGFGWITVEEGVVRSSNVCMAQIGTDMGLNQMMTVLEGAMLFEKPGLGMPTETAGLLPEHAVKNKRGVYPEKFDTDEATAAYGQGPAMSPLAIMCAYAEIANGGYSVQPRIVLGTANDIGGIVGSVDRKTSGYAAYKPGRTERLSRDHPYKEETVEAVRKILIDVVNSEHGTGKRARLSSGLTVAGKTGTAQVKLPGRDGYAEGKYLASFIGFFPAERPKYLVLVMFMSPRGKFYGGEIAAPVFAKVADRICYLDRISPEVYVKSKSAA